MRGRENMWKVIHIGELSTPFKDMVWFAGKVWGTSDYGLWTIVNDKVDYADIPANAHACSGNYL